jgi:starch synthase
LADTVADVTSYPLLGTGISFEAPTAAALDDAVRRGLALYRKPGIWADLRRRAMAQDYSWERSASGYEDLYERTRRAPQTDIPAGP